ncbi:MAG TPA: hypothetical protein VIV11_30655 [Kofleriaceae bacterium]
MLLSWLLRQVLMYGGLAVAALAVASLVHASRLRGELPRAKVMTRKGELRRLLVRWLRPLASVLGIAMFFWAFVHNIEYVIVTDGAEGPTAERRYSYEDNPNVAIAPGTSSPSKAQRHDPVWVVNRSTRTVRVQTVQYGGGLSFGAAPIEIPPSTAAHFRRIDFIGPRDVPPNEVRESHSLGMSFREWLTW